MTSNPPPSSANPNRLYTRFIKILKIVQIIGYCIVALYAVLISINLPFLGYGMGLLRLLPIVWALVSCTIVYITTQALIAIIDLLSRIEQNTRSQQ